MRKFLARYSLGRGLRRFDPPDNALRGLPIISNNNLRNEVTKHVRRTVV